jgi:hypothetical protein
MTSPNLAGLPLKLWRALFELCYNEQKDEWSLSEQSVWQIDTYLRAEALSEAKGQRSNLALSGDFVPRNDN